MRRKLIGILRGLEPDRAVEVARVLLEAGISRIEVPLNSPDPFHSIRAMVDAHGARGLFGAGTVLEVEDIARLADVGGTFVVSPNCDVDVIRKTKDAGLGSYPGVFTPSECFVALRAGADALKIFPADLLGPAGVRAIRAVLPKETEIYAVGGASAANFPDWMAAGTDGFGIGSALFKPGRSLDEIAAAAAACVTAYDRALG